jgi:hypothetical protein
MSIGIDKQSGALVVAGETIPSGLSENAFSRSQLGQQAMRTPTTGGWVVYSNIKIDDAGLVMRFLDGKLTEISLAWGERSGGWGGWSEVKEASENSAQNKWLASKLGLPPYSFEWGNVESLQDQKAGGSQILIRYNSKRRSKDNGSKTSNVDTPPIDE